MNALSVQPACGLKPLWAASFELQAGLVQLERDFKRDLAAVIAALEKTDATPVIFTILSKVFKNFVARNFESPSKNQLDKLVSSITSQSRLFEIAPKEAYRSIKRVCRKFLGKYHPDNRTDGNTDLFIITAEMCSEISVRLKAKGLFYGS